MTILYQRGATMISLLVGMVVSMLAILASLSMFHNLVRTSTEAKADARMEGDLSLAVLRLDQELLAAGFNMPASGRNQDFVVVNRVAGATLNSWVSRVAWRFSEAPNPGGNPQCRRAVSTFNIPQLQYTLELFNANPGLCTTAGAMPDANDESLWTRTEQLASLRLQALDAATPVTLTRPLIEFASDPVNDGACMPYGAAASLAPGATATVRPRLVLNVFDTAAAYTTAPNIAVPRAHTLCLINISL